MLTTLLDRQSRKNLWYYARFLRRYRSMWTVAILGSLSEVLMRLPMPLLTGYVIDHVINQHRGRALNAISGLLILVTLVYLALAYSAQYLTFRIHQSVSARFKLKIFQHVLDLPILYTGKKETGYLMVRILQDPEYLNGLVLQVVSVANSLITFVAGLLTMVLISPRLAVLSAALVPLFGASYVLFQKKIRNLDNGLKEQEAIISRGLKESLSSILVTKLFNLRSRQSRRFLQTLRREIEIATSSFNYGWAVNGISSFLAALGPLAVIWYGGHEVITGSLTIGQLVAFSSLLSFLYGPTKSIIGSQVGFLKSLVSLNRICEVLNEPDESSLVDETPVGHVPNQAGIQFRNVSFGYATRNSVLTGISFSIRPGERVALVGRTGSGKSTIVGLISGLYKADSGSIQIGDLDVGSAKAQTVRKLVGVLPQSPFLFSASIYDNIVAGRATASRDEVIAAARQANVLQFIESLPQRFETTVGEEGHMLSGGQKQLICLARVILRNAPILILDEPTAAIDAKTEALMQYSLSQFMKGRTVVIISHRLSTILGSDRFLVLEEGQVHDSVGYPNLFESETSLNSGSKPLKHESLSAISPGNL